MGTRITTILSIAIGAVVANLWRINLQADNSNFNYNINERGGGDNLTLNNEPMSTILQISNSTRSRVHWCYFRNHMLRPMNILKKEFGYTDEVDPEAGDEWDMIFGGYPHCGEQSSHATPRNKFDWKMEHGLNAHLNKQGWDNLQPHQVWFPCMGCKESYCNKRDLCHLTRKIDPNSCFVLPEDNNRLLDIMKQSGKQQFWVLKEDSPYKHLHVGAGVRFIKSEEELPTDEEQRTGDYIVQPFAQHKMGVGEYQRRHELKMYLSVTSTSPLRAYVYSAGIHGRFANSPVNHTNPLDPCSVDTHDDRTLQRIGCNIEKKYSTVRSNDHIFEKLRVTQSDQHSFANKTNQLLANILLEAQPQIQDHVVNKGITKSGATCFSFLRVDFAMTDALEPHIYEINEFPFANQKGFAGEVQENAYRELFQMIGLDQPPMAASGRMEYEMKNLGKWTPLI